MLLYHGTTGRIAERASVEGLKPREGKAGNWPGKPSRSDCVYLTTVYGPAYATTAHKRAGGSLSDEVAVLEIDTDRLTPEALLPDEDFLDQCVSMRERRAGLTPGELKKKKGQHFKRIRELLATLGSYGGYDWYRQLRKEYGDLFEWVHGLQQSRRMRGWEASVEAMGTCAFLGTISPNAIARIVYWRPEGHPLFRLFDSAAPAIDSYHRRDKEMLGRANQWLFDGYQQGILPEGSAYPSRDNIRLEVRE